MPARAEARTETAAKKARRKPGTAPTNSWTRRAHRRLSDLLGAAASRHPLPDLDVDAKRVILAMEAELDERDPALRLSASVRQIERVQAYCRALGTPPPMVAGKLSKADAKVFLDEHAWFSPPTERQMGYARNIAEHLGLEIFKERGVWTFASVSKFIREHADVSRSLRNDHETEQQLKRYEGGTYAALQQAAYAGVDYGDM